MRYLSVRELYALVALVLVMGIGGCKHAVAVAETPAEAKLGKVEDSRGSKIASGLEVAIEVSNQVTDARVKQALQGVLQTTRAFASWTPLPDDISSFRKAANEILDGKEREGQASLDELRAAAIANISSIAYLKDQIVKEKADSASKINAAIEENTTKWTLIIFFATGALLVAGGAVGFFLVLTNPVAYPILGPKACAAIAGAGFVLIGTGIAINAIQRAIHNHPVIVSLGSGIAIVLIAAACALFYANHHNATKSQ